MFVSVLLILGMTPSPSFAVEDSDGGSASSAASAAVDQASSDEAEEQQLETLLDVKYVYIESPQIGIGSTQNIVVGLEDGVSLPSDATLFFASGSNSEIFEAPLSRSVSGAMLFEVETNALVEGEYHLIRVESETESTVASIDFAADESDYSFTVTSALSSGEDSDESADLATDTGVSTSVVTTDESGNEVEADSIEEAIDEAGSDNVVTPFSAGESREERSAGRSSRLIVVLDPGHGGYDPGASGNGVQESTVNLKIAQYCRDELSEYQNVTVLMTRESDVYVSLQDRVDYAVSNNADLVVGIHNNSATVSSANGAEVIVPRAGEYHEIGEDLGNLILDQIEALGLERRQVYSKDCTTGDRYDDGTLEDYYTMIAGPREHGITGIIVEHAFVSNGSDASFLKSDANLKRLGVADATAIANYYGLSKHPSLHGFSDVFSYTDHVDDIGWLASTGISEGFPDGTFRPMAGVARQDMAAFLYRLAGSPSYTPSASAKAAFSDVDSSTPHYKEVLWLAETGISEGFPDGTFRGMSTVARQDMAAFLRRTYDYMTGGASEGWTASSSWRSCFADVTSSTDHAEDIWWLAAMGITTGFSDHTYRGTSSVVRQDMAAFLFRTANCEGEEIPCDDQPIMGSSVVTASQLVAYYKASGCAYPSAIYSGKGAASIEDFAQTVAEEAAAEGVRAEVVFCQAMHETGWLQFGGDVKAEQCNFAGLGATGGVAGATFPDVRTGIRAQVQHLKAYASTESLVNDCVDPRFDLVERGCAPYLSGLSGRWAVGDSYGQKIASMVDDLCMA